MQLKKVQILGLLGLALGFATGIAGMRLVILREEEPSGSGRETGTAVLEPIAPPEGWDTSLGAPPRFVDVARAVGVSFQHVNGLTGKFHYPEIMGAGVALFDYDGDGHLDMYFVQGNHLLEKPDPGLTNKLYHNEGDGTFLEVSGKAGVADAGFGQGVCVGDYDGDGDCDFYVSNYGPNLLYRNNGDGTFTNVAASAGVEDPSWGQTCSFLDYNGDGWADLYVQNYLTYSLRLKFEAFIYIGNKKMLDYPSPRGFRGAPDHLYRNNGDGTFTDVTEASGLLRPDGKGMGCACFDYDDDGHVDLFIANDTTANFLFHNLGDGTFEEVGLAAGVAFDGTGIAEASMGVSVGDYNGDGRMDMAIPCVWQQIYSLYRNDDGFFTDVSLSAGLVRSTAPRTGFSPNFIDYDNDGDEDLFFSNGGVRVEQTAAPEETYLARYGISDLLLANNSRDHYTDVSRFAGRHFKRKLIGRGSVVGDLDNDGDLDIVVSNLAGDAVVLRNDTPSRNHWIILQLVGERGSRDALGASVWCEAGGKRRRAIVHGDVSYLSQNDRRLHFGLGPAAAIDRLEIRWPDGTAQVLENQAADRILKVRKSRKPGR